MSNARTSLQIAAVMGIAVSLSGCVIPAGFRMPQLLPRSIEYERAETAVHDPFPITDAGPDISARPREFETPRPDPARVKEKAGISQLRNQLGTPVPPSYVGASNPTYVGAVR